jgi:hypothetical protein
MDDVRHRYRPTLGIELRLQRSFDDAAAELRGDGRVLPVVEALGDLPFGEALRRPLLLRAAVPEQVHRERAGGGGDHCPSDDTGRRPARHLRAVPASSGAETPLDTLER